MASSINADNGVISGSSGLKSSADASGVLALQTNGTTAVTVNTSQQVGVGTTNPSTIFNVVDANVAGNDNLGNVYIRTTDSYASADVGGKLTLGGFYNGAAHFAFAGIAGRKENATVNNVAGYLQLLTTTSGGALTERARISSTGGFSVGTTTDPGAGKIADVYGNVRSVPPVGTKTSSYTLTTADVGRYVQLGASGAIVIPDATFSEGDVVSIFNNTASTATITCTITTAYIAGTYTDKATMTLAAAGVATILFISGTVCVVSGNVS